MENLKEESKGSRKSKEELKNLLEIIKPTLYEIVSKKILKYFESTNFFKLLNTDSSEIDEIIRNTKIEYREMKDINIKAQYNLYKNTIYLSENIGINNLSDNNIIHIIHEFLHSIQNFFCKFNIHKNFGYVNTNIFSKYGTALNEATISYMAAKICDSKYEFVKYYFLEFATISPEFYPIITAIFEQLMFLTQDKFLFVNAFLFDKSDKYINFWNTFKSKFIKPSYKEFLKIFDHILKKEEKIAKIYSLLCICEDLEKRAKILENIKKEKENLRDLVMNIQQILYTNFFNTELYKIECNANLDEYLLKLDKYVTHIITTENNYAFDQFKELYIQKINYLKELQSRNNEEFEKRKEEYLNLNTELMVKESIFKNVANKLRKIFKLNKFKNIYKFEERIIKI